MFFKDEYELKTALVNRALKEKLEALKAVPKTIKEAMEYSLMADGKRLRPVIMLSANELAKAAKLNEDEYMQKSQQAAAGCLPLACGIEMIHTYSLIHDDLPAMDDDDLRRGIPTNHVVFGEAIAILAGDALLNYAYETMLDGILTASDNKIGYLMAVKAIADAAGVNGMIGGQVADIESEGSHIDERMLNYIHDHKTGALIVAALKAGVLAETDDKDLLDNVTEYGRCLGIAFQITDDILDVTGNPKVFGKNIGSDEKSGKLTFPARYGLEESKKLANEYIQRAIHALSMYDGKNQFLTELAMSILNRSK